MYEGSDGRGGPLTRIAISAGLVLTGSLSISWDAPEVDTSVLGIRPKGEQTSHIPYT